MKFNVLKEKVVINTSTGEMLGYIKDIGMDMKQYTIQCFMVEDHCGLLSRVFPVFFKRKTYMIDIEDIVSIGNDVILVSLKKDLKQKVSSTQQ